MRLWGIVVLLCVLCTCYASECMIRSVVNTANGMTTHEANNFAACSEYLPFVARKDAKASFLPPGPLGYMSCGGGYQCESPWWTFMLPFVRHDGGRGRCKLERMTPGDESWYLQRQHARELQHNTAHAPQNSLQLSRILAKNATPNTRLVVHMVDEDVVETRTGLARWHCYMDPTFLYPCALVCVHSEASTTTIQDEDGNTLEATPWRNVLVDCILDCGDENAMSTVTSLFMYFLLLVALSVCIVLVVLFTRLRAKMSAYRRTAYDKRHADSEDDRAHRDVYSKLACSTPGTLNV